jgi:hypothetical protein
MDATRLYHTLYGYRRNDNVSIERIETEDPDAYSILVDMIAQDHVYQPKATAFDLCTLYESHPRQSLLDDVTKSMQSKELKLASSSPNVNAAASAVGYVRVYVCVCMCMCMCVLLSSQLTKVQ